MKPNFDAAFNFLMQLEGGFRLHQVAGDSGGMTYAGIARNKHPEWKGWEYIDEGENPPLELVKGFYLDNYWEPCKCPRLIHHCHAQSLFCCAVNMGVKKAVLLAQAAAGAKPDGVIGPKTIEKINTSPCFLERFTVAKVARYSELVRRNRKLSKFLHGWINRALKEGECNV